MPVSQVGAELEPDDAVDLAVAPGHQDDADARGRAELAGEREPVLAGEAGGVAGLATVWATAGGGARTTSAAPSSATPPSEQKDVNLLCNQ